MVMGFSVKDQVVATKIVAIDGSGQFIDIQEAIDDLPVGGGVVYIKEGTYNLTTKINLSSSNISIKGAGYSTNIVVAAGNYGFEIPSGSNKCSIDSLRISAPAPAGRNGIEVSADDCFITGCWMDGINVGIVVDTGLRTGILNNIISAQQGGITLSLTAQTDTFSVIIGNRINSVTGSAIFLYKVNKNIVADNIVKSEDSIGINVSYLADLNIVEGNNVCECGGDGIAVNTFSDRNIINDNIAASNTNIGIVIAAATDDRNIVDGNVAYNNGVAQITDGGTNSVIGDNVTA